MHTPSEGLPALQVLGRVLHEQAALFYTADAQVRWAAWHVVREALSIDKDAWHAALCLAGAGLRCCSC